MNSAKAKPLLQNLTERTFADRAFSLSTFLNVAIPGGFLALVADPARGSGSFFTWFGVVTLATVISGAFFVAFGLLVFNRMRGWIRVAVGMLGFATTGVIRGGLLGLLGFQSGAIDEVNWQFRLGGGAIVASVMLPVVATLVNDFNTYSSRFAQLAAKQKRLEELTSNAKAELESKRALVLSDVNSRLGVAIDDISKALRKGKSNSDYQALASRLLEAVETVVRPLSKELLIDQLEFTASRSEVKAPRVKFRDWRVSATLSKPLSPGPVTVIWAAIGASTITSLRPGFPGVLAYPLFVSSTWALLELGRRLLTPRLDSMSFRVRSAAILCAYLVAAVIPAWLSWIPLANIDRPGFEALAVTLLVLDPLATIFYCVALAMLAGLQRERARVLAETKEVNRKLSWELASISARLRAARKQISRSLHSDVQAVFIANAIKLQAGIRSDTVTKELLRELVQNLKAIGIVNPDNKTAPSLTAAVQDLKSFWGDGLEITCEFDGAAEAALVANDVLRATLVDVVSEAVINAVKHAKSSRVKILLALEPGVLKLQVSNDGEPVPENVLPGSGLKFVREVTVESGLANTKDGTILSAVIPLGTP